MKHQGIIDEIRKDAKSGGKEYGAANALVRFSELLCLLSEEADNQADKNQKLQEAVLRYTKLLFVLTLVLSAVGIFQVFTFACSN